ncbi:MULTISPECIES: AlpA family phage regulatory protein [Burkholderia]|nr:MULTISPECIES: AlpA family phage regulatory protein [Burkholderia]
MRPLIERVGLSKSEIYRRIQAGTFPRPIALGVRAVGWLERDVELWLATRAKRGEA